LEQVVPVPQTETFAEHPRIGLDLQRVHVQAPQEFETFATPQNMSAPSVETFAPAPSTQHMNVVPVPQDGIIDSPVSVGLKTTENFPAPFFQAHREASDLWAKICKIETMLQSCLENKLDTIIAEVQKVSHATELILPKFDSLQSCLESKLDTNIVAVQKVSHAIEMIMPKFEQLQSSLGSKLDTNIVAVQKVSQASDLIMPRFELLQSCIGDKLDTNNVAVQKVSQVTELIVPKFELLQSSMGSKLDTNNVAIQKVSRVTDLIMPEFGLLLSSFGSKLDTNTVAFQKVSQTSELIMPKLELLQSCLGNKLDTNTGAVLMTAGFEKILTRVDTLDRELTSILAGDLGTLQDTANATLVKTDAIEGIQLHQGYSELHFLEIKQLLHRLLPAPQR